jgi:hypothetical protein
MGYTHYWQHGHDFKSEQWADVARFAADAIAKSGVVITGWDGSNGPLINADEISFNGQGEDGHETFRITRLKRELMDYEADDKADPDAPRFDFCKTARKPYDVVVVAILLYIHALTGTDVMEISSDGNIFGELVEVGELDPYDEYGSAQNLLNEIAA